MPALLESGTRVMKNLGEEASGYVCLNGAWTTEIGSGEEEACETGWGA